MICSTGRAPTLQAQERLMERRKRKDDQIRECEHKIEVMRVPHQVDMEGQAEYI